MKNIKTLFAIIIAAVFFLFIGFTAFRGIVMFAIKSGYITCDGKFTKKWGLLFHNNFSNLSRLNINKLSNDHRIILPKNVRLMKIVEIGNSLHLILLLEEMQTRLNLFIIPENQEVYPIKELVTEAGDVQPESIDYFEPIIITVQNKTTQLTSLKVTSTLFGMQISFNSLIGSYEGYDTKYQFMATAGPGAQEPSAKHVEFFMNEFLKQNTN